MHKTESILENGTNKVLVMQTDHMIPARGPYREMINKKKENLPNSGLRYPSRPRSENHRKGKERQVLRSCLKTKKSYGT